MFRMVLEKTLQLLFSRGYRKEKQHSWFGFIYTINDSKEQKDQEMLFSEMLLIPLESSPLPAFNKASERQHLGDGVCSTYIGELEPCRLLLCPLWILGLLDHPRPLQSPGAVLWTFCRHPVKIESETGRSSQRSWRTSEHLMARTEPLSMSLAGVPDLRSIPKGHLHKGKHDTSLWLE